MKRITVMFVGEGTRKLCRTRKINNYAIYINWLNNPLFCSQFRLST